ncbi:uncharacterized protein [Eurosta solidaginis]|uniref:uncharacterized protein n=1 Tax=Eurosta solidaginis TaxID=178769 RepID=UPI0035314D05
MADTELIMKIISAVKKRDCLWNVNSAEYAKRDKLEKAWQEVADDVGRPDVFCREKWRNVRTGFLRSIQYNTARNENIDGTDDLPTPRRKRFYLYDEIKFILQSKEALGQTTKRRKLSRNNKMRTSNDEYTTTGTTGGSLDFGDNSTTMQMYSANDDTKDNNRYKNSSNNNSNEVTHNTSNSKYPELLNELQHNNAKPMTTRQSLAAATPVPIKINHQPSPPLKIDEAKIEPNMHSTPLVSGAGAPSVQTKCENNSTIAEPFNLNSTGMQGKCDERDEQQLLAFFRGNLYDILSLPRHKQRLFKRRMLELIDDLHGLDNGIGTNRYT